MQNISIYFYLLIPIVAFLYASVGHGGASGYLALMALFNFMPEQMRPTSLILNILVSAVAFLYYYKNWSMNWRLFFTLIVASVPAAFIGGTMVLNHSTYKQLLGIMLLLPALNLVFNSKKQKTITNPNMLFVMIIGLCIGLISGILGIGGGILLSPILLLLGYCDIKETATISALFITLNSIAGLIGASTIGIEWSFYLFVIVVLALVGGVLGAYFGAKKFENRVLRLILSFVLLIASVKLILT